MADDRGIAFRGLQTCRRPGRRAAGQLRGLTPLASELFYGVLRHRSRLDWIIETAAGKELRAFAPDALDVLRLGVYQILYTASIPPYAAVSESVELARAVVPRAAGFVNWVLRRLPDDADRRPARDELEDRRAWLAAYYSFPAWLVQRWVERFGEEEAEELMAATNTFPPLDVRVNLLRTGTEDCAGELEAAAAGVLRGRYAPAALSLLGARNLTGQPAFREGRIYVQDQSSQLPALALGARPGERILDACAGLGGKTTQLAELTGGGARITALDPDAGRLSLLEQNIRRLGLPGITIVRGRLPDTGPGGREGFDRILVDAPCSALGTIRRHPELKWAKKPTDPARLARLQLGLLEDAAGLLRGGGTLAYSTCTTEDEENEEVMRRFRERHPDFTVHVPGGGIRNTGELLTPEGFLRTWPHRHGMNGSFLAIVKKG